MDVMATIPYSKLKPMEQSRWPMGMYRTLHDKHSSDLVYRRFIDSIISFFMIGFVLYILARIYGAVTSESIIKHSYKCKYCRKEIPETVRLNPNNLSERLIQFVFRLLDALFAAAGWMGGRIEGRAPSRQHNWNLSQGQECINTPRL
jgi:large-conductance mechanosensitive channel